MTTQMAVTATPAASEIHEPGPKTAKAPTSGSTLANTVTAHHNAGAGNDGRGITRQSPPIQRYCACHAPLRVCYRALILDASAFNDLSNSATRASRSAFTCWNAVSPAPFNSATF